MQRVWHGMEYREEVDFCAPQLLPGPREPRLAWRPRFPGQGARKSRPENFPNSQPLGIGVHHMESGKYFTKQERHMSDGCGLRNPHTDPRGRLRKVSFVAAGALEIRGDSQNPGDGSRDAGKAPEWPATRCSRGAFLVREGRMSPFQEPKGLGATEREPLGLQGTCPCSAVAVQLLD